MQVFEPRPEERPIMDFVWLNHGSIVTFSPLTERARDWWEEHVQDGPRWGGSYAVESRYAQDLLVGMRGDGLNV